jgi:hypothetical protein
MPNDSPLPPEANSLTVNRSKATAKAPKPLA